LSTEMQARVSNCLPHVDADSLLSALSELLGIRWPLLSPQWPLREVLREQTNREGGPCPSIHAIPEGLTLRHAAHLWRLVALSFLDAAPVPKNPPPSDRGVVSMEIPLPDFKLRSSCFSYTELHCHQGLPVEHSAQWQGPVPKPQEAVFHAQPPLPEGLAIDAAGDIRGTPLITWHAVHVVSCRTSGGARRAELLLRVLPVPPPPFRYELLLCAAGSATRAMPIFRNTLGALVAYFKVDPPLPVGLQLDLSTGEVFGKPQIVAKSRHAVLAWNDGGESVATLDIDVVLQCPAQFTYSTHPVRCGTAVNFMPKPLDAGPLTGPGLAFELAEGVLMSGLTLDIASGAVQGMPLEVGEIVCRVRAQNRMGRTAARLKFKVLPPDDIVLELRRQVENRSFFAGATIADVWMNPSARPGGILYERFRPGRLRGCCGPALLPRVPWDGTRQCSEHQRERHGSKQACWAVDGSWGVLRKADEHFDQLLPWRCQNAGFRVVA